MTKPRTTVLTEEAFDLQLLIARATETEAGKLEFRFITTYLESFVDLDAKPEPVAVLICTEEYASDLVFREIDKMCNNIISNYPQVKKVTVYGRDALIREFDRPGATFPKSTVIGPHEHHDNDLELYMSMVETDTVFEVRDAIFKRDLKFQSTLPGNSDLEAGEIRIVIEAESSQSE